MKRFYDLPHSPSRGQPLGWLVIGGIGIVLLIGLLFSIPLIFEWRSASLFTQAQSLVTSDPLAAARKAEAAYWIFPDQPAMLSFAIAAQTREDSLTARRLTRELLTNPRATPRDFQIVLAAFAHLPIEEYATLVQSFPDSVQVTPELLARLSQRWETAGDLPLATAYAARAAQAEPTPQNALRLGLLLARVPATQMESLAWLKLAIEKGDASTASTAFPALAALAALPTEKISETFIPNSTELRKKFPDANPSQLFALFRIGWQLHPETRTEQLDQLAEWQRGIPRQELAVWLSAQGNSEQLIEWITPKEALTTAPVFELYAQALLASRREDELLALLPEDFNLSPATATALLQYLRTQKQTAALLRLASQLHAQSPDNRDYLQLTAYLHFLNGNVDETLLNALSVRAEAEPDQRALRTTLAFGYLQKGEAPRALEILSADLNARDTLSDSERLVVARALSRTGNPREARAWRKDISAEPLLPEERKLLTQP